ncbi:hypothetical protein MYO4S_00064 [Serratia phage 4S]|nr:hypothetical protein MYO4S_00064 [Serratia phage 4S]
MKRYEMTQNMPRCPENGINALYDQARAINAKAKEDLCIKTLGLLYPGKSIQWCLDNRALIDSEYSLEIIEQRTDTYIIEYTVNVRKR